MTKFSRAYFKMSNAGGYHSGWIAGGNDCLQTWQQQKQEACQCGCWLDFRPSLRSQNSYGGWSRRNSGTWGRDAMMT